MFMTTVAEDIWSEDDWINTFSLSYNEIDAVTIARVLFWHTKHNFVVTRRTGSHRWNKEDITFYPSEDDLESIKSILSKFLPQDVKLKIIG